MFLALLCVETKKKNGIPSVCQRVDDISNKELYETELIASKTYCFYVVNSLFVNGAPVKLHGYDQEQEKVVGYGNAIITDQTKYKGKTLVAIESNQTQRVVLLGSIDINSDSVYVATDNHVEEFDLLQQKLPHNEIYQATLLYLGPKTSTKIKVKTGDSISGAVVEADGGIHHINERTTGSYSYTHESYMKIMAYSYSSKEYFNIDIEAKGSDWVTPMNGFLTPSNWKVYSADSLMQPIHSHVEGASFGAIIAIIFIIICIFIVFSVTIYRIFKKRHSSNDDSDERNLSQMDQSLINEDGMQYVGQPIMPQPIYPAPTMMPQPMYPQQQMYSQQQMTPEQLKYQQEQQQMYQQQQMTPGQPNYPQQQQMTPEQPNYPQQQQMTPEQQKEMMEKNPYQQ